MENSVKISIPANGSWAEQKVKLKQKFEVLTDEDLANGDRDKIDILKKIGVKLGKSTEELHAIIAAL